MTPALIINDGQHEPTIITLDGAVAAGADPHHIVLGYDGERMVTLDLTGVPSSWAHDLVAALWRDRFGDAQRRHAGVRT